MIFMRPMRKNKIILISGVCFVLLSLLVALSYTYMPWFHQINTATQKTVLHPMGQGLYESCAPVDGDACLKHLHIMAQAGFTLVVNYNQFYGTEAQELAYAKEAHSLGMQVIWGMSSPLFWNGNDLRKEFKDLAPTCNCRDNEGFITYIVNLVKNLPATWGYYIGDEVTHEKHDIFKSFADHVRVQDPVHPRLFIAGASTTSMGENLTPFVDSAEVVGADIYPIGTADPLSSVGPISQAVQSIATQNNKQSVLVLQAFNWAEYPKDTWVCARFPYCARFPSSSEMRRMRDYGMKNANPQFILWYSYFDINRSDNPASHMQDLIDAASSPVSTPTP